MMHLRTSTAWTHERDESWTHNWLRVYEPDQALTEEELERLGENERRDIENHEAYSEGSGGPGAMFHHGVQLVSVAQTFRGSSKRYPVVTVLIDQYGGYDI